MTKDRRRKKAIREIAERGGISYTAAVREYDQVQVALAQSAAGDTAPVRTEYDPDLDGTQEDDDA